MSKEADTGAAGADTTTEGAADGKTIVETTAAGAGDGAAASAATEGSAGAEGKPQDATPDWRVRMAGEDKDALKRLGRFTDEGQFFKSYRALEQKLSSGEVVKKLAPDATAEELATWRKENGIPEKPEAYVEGFKSPKGIVLSEADKPIVGEIAAAALDGNVPPEAFNKIVEKYYEVQEAQAAAQAEADATYKQQAEDTLRGLWQGAEYRQNLVAVQNLMAGWPEGLAAQVLAGRDPEGRKLGDNPAFIQQLAALQRELNPMAALVPAGSSDPGKAGQARLDEIKGWMGAKSGSPEHAKYWKDEKVQAEYRSLIDAQNTIKGRSAA